MHGVRRPDVRDVMILNYESDLGATERNGGWRVAVERPLSWPEE